VNSGSSGAVIFRSRLHRMSEVDFTAEDLAVQEATRRRRWLWRWPFVHAPPGHSDHMQRHPRDRTARVPRLGISEVADSLPPIGDRRSHPVIHA
jgi:hypothetical protein